jgi:hypothetical protein
VLDFAIKILLKSAEKIQFWLKMGLITDTLLEYICMLWLLVIIGLCILQNCCEYALSAAVTNSTFVRYRESITGSDNRGKARFILISSLRYERNITHEIKRIYSNIGAFNSHFKCY